MTFYKNQASNIALHYSSYVLNHIAMIGIYTVQNSLAFLCTWEIMAISAFILVIFEHHKIETLKAGINYLIQSHLCIVFLTIGFIWVSSSTGSYDFRAISTYSASAIPSLSFLLFVCFFIAFSFKAGFVPFHLAPLRASSGACTCFGRDVRCDHKAGHIWNLAHAIADP
jgi:formate hydrogenlyase subunit 3/multisubunit Na+/H+ antiporter MnhD subunit